MFADCKSGLHVESWVNISVEVAVFIKPCPQVGSIGMDPLVGEAFPLF